MGKIARAMAHVSLAKDRITRPVREATLQAKGDILTERQEDRAKAQARAEAAAQFQTALAGGKEALTKFLSTLKVDNDEDLAALVTLATQHDVDTKRIPSLRHLRKAQTPPETVDAEVVSA